MSDVFSWHSPSSRLVLNAVLALLAEFGWDGLTVEEVRLRSGPAGVVLDDSTDLEALVIAALEHVEMFPSPQPTGDLRRDLRLLLEPWRNGPGSTERVVAAVLSAALWRPQLRAALHEALDRPLNRSIAKVLTHAGDRRDVPPGLVQTMCWVLRGLLVDHLRSGPRTAVDLDRLVDFLVAGVQGSTPDKDTAAAPDNAATEGPLT